MSHKSKKQSNAEFLAKLKTINIGTGAKNTENDECPNCGNPLSEHKFKVVDAVAVPIFAPGKPKTDEETAFAA